MGALNRLRHRQGYAQKGDTTTPVTRTIGLATLGICALIGSFSGPARTTPEQEQMYAARPASPAYTQPAEEAMLALQPERPVLDTVQRNYISPQLSYVQE